MATGWNEGVPISSQLLPQFIHMLTCSPWVLINWRDSGCAMPKYAAFLTIIPWKAADLVRTHWPSFPSGERMGNCWKRCSCYARSIATSRSPETWNWSWEHLWLSCQHDGLSSCTVLTNFRFSELLSFRHSNI